MKLDLNKLNRIDAACENLQKRLDFFQTRRNDAEFNEADHPRSGNGQFGSGGGGGEASEKFDWDKFDEHADSRKYGAPSKTAALPQYENTAREFEKAMRSSDDPKTQLNAVNKLKRQLLDSPDHKPGAIMTLHSGTSNYIKNMHGAGSVQKPVSNGERIAKYLGQKWIGPRK